MTTTTTPMSATTDTSTTTERTVGDQVTRQEAIEIVERLAAVKSRQAVDEAVEIYHPDGVLLCPPFRSEAHGRDEIRTSLVRFFGLLPDYTVELDGYGIDGVRLAAWGTIRFTLQRTLDGTEPNGHQVATPVFILFEFRDGHVVWESFHFDLADVARQSDVPTASLERR
jgi:predicted ester cyclase